MSPKRLPRLAPVMLLTLIVPLFWIGQAISAERTIRVYKNPT